MKLRHTTTATLAMAVLGLAACGTGTSNNRSGNANVSSPSPSAEAGVASRVTVNKTFYYLGFKVTVGEARYTPTHKDPKTGFTTRGELVIDTEIENLGTDVAELSPERSVASSGENYTDFGPHQETPQVPGLAKGKGAFAFVIDKAFKMSDAVLTVGNPANNVAVITLSSSSSSKDRLLAPAEQSITGTLVAGDLQMTISGMTVRYDGPKQHREMKAKRAELTINFSLTRTSGTGGGQNFFGSSFSLTVPDGTSITEGGSGSSPNEIIEPGKTIQDLTLFFVIETPFDGAYTLAYKDSTRQGSFAFNLQSNSSGSAGPSPSPGAQEPSPAASGH